MNKYKYFLILIVILSPFFYAFIYDEIPGLNNFEGFKVIGFSKNSEFLINDKKIKLKTFLTDSHQGDVIGYYLSYAKEKDFEIIDNQYIKNMANILLKYENYYYNPDFDCIFYIDKNKTGNLVIASTVSDKTKVIFMKIPVNINTTINLKKIKNLKLPDEISGILYMKFSEGKNNYTSFYYGILNTSNFNFVIGNWLKKLKEEKWQITELNSKNENNKFLFLKKNKNEYFITLTIIERKYYLSIIG